MTDLTPMLASIGSGLPVGGSWVFEPKYDGIRILAFAADNRVRLMSRNGLDKTRQFPEVAEPEERESTQVVDLITRLQESLEMGKKRGTAQRRSPRKAAKRKSA